MMSDVAVEQTPRDHTSTSAEVIEADAIVVGAGPAGAATAAHLARRGLQVLLLEKATFPATRSAATA